MNATSPAMRASAIELWREDFARINMSAPKRQKPKLLLLPNWWPSANSAFAYFRTVFIGPGLLRAPSEVRTYLLAHELGHIRRRHTLGQVTYWPCVVIAVALSGVLPRHFAMMPIALVLAGANAWIIWGEEKREYEADDEAAAVCGDAGVINGLCWMQTRRGEAKKLDAKRISRCRRRLARA